jgi:hypothetical protein
MLHPASPAIAELLREDRLQPLGPGTPNAAVKAKLRSLSPESALAPHPVKDHDMACACLAGLWLCHDFLEESHTLSQAIDTPTGSYWHGVMHRREPDYANAKYWFRRVGNHPIYDALCTGAAELAGASELLEAAEFLKRQSEWDPFAFIDLCEASLHGQSSNEMFCRRIQQKEWELLFDYCCRQATGSAR